MKKHKETLFSTKFRLLNSQEHSEEINWSSSDSSEYEDCNNKVQLLSLTKKKPNRKRKRKLKSPDGVVSHLDVTIIDSITNSPNQKSPVLLSKANSKSVPSVRDLTYLIEVKPENNYREATTTSPVLCTGQVRTNLCMKSPVIAQKFASPANSPKVRKTLFKQHDTITNKSPQHTTECENIKYFKQDLRKIQDNLEKSSISMPVVNENSQGTLDVYISEKKGESDCKRINVDLIRKVKSFFENHFNSENSSQHSIADSLTPKNDSNDDVEILSAVTQVNSSENSITSLQHTNSTNNSEIEAEKSKKMKYKKDGLAYRLNALLKKHTANISLWQHERFLAENSNFRIPKGEHLVFQIQSSVFRFGCFLLEAMDVNDDLFLILINKSYVNNCIFNKDAILNLYEPYQIYSFEHYKLIINVCKFEFVMIDK